MIKAYIGSEIEIPVRDKSDKLWTFEDITELYESEGNAISNSTGATGVTPDDPFFEKALPSGRDDNIRYSVIDAQGHSTITDFKEIRQWVSRMESLLSKSFDLEDCRVDYWLWLPDYDGPGYAGMAVLKEDGLYHIDDPKPEHQEGLSEDQIELIIVT